MMLNYCIFYRYRYGHFSLALASFWSYLSATTSLMMSDITLNVYVGVIMILCILTEGAVAMTVAVHLFGPDTFHLSAYLEPASLMGHAAEHVCVCVTSFVEPRLLVFLPWKTSEFSLRSNGFPSLIVFKAIIYVKSCCSMLRVAILIVAHKSTNSTRLSICFSILVLVFSISEGLLKLKSEKIQQYDSAIVSKAALCEMHEKADRGGGDDVVLLEKSSEDKEQTIALLQLEIEELRMANRRNSVREDDVEDLEKAYVAKTEFPDENLGVDLGGSPLEYIPLEKIEEELAGLTNKANSGEIFDERRLDHLLACMKRNPEYLAMIEVKQREEREKLAPILEQHLATMREFIPPNIFDCTMTTLQEDCGYSKALAKRLISKKCLRLVRMRPEDIMKLHEVELTGQYSHGGQVLDVVEKTALLAACPKKFENDGRGVKKKYLLDLEENVKDMIHKAEAGSLSKQLLRHSAYTNQVGRFGANTEMHRPDVTSGRDVFNPRTSYKPSNPISTDIGLTEESVLLGQFNSVDGSDFSPDPSPASRNGSSSVGIGSDEFLKRSSSLEQMFRRKSSLAKCNEEEVKCAGIGRNEFTKRSSSDDDAVLLEKSSEDKEQTIVLLQLEIEELRMANRRNSMREEDVENSKKAYVAQTEFPDENLGVVKAQLLELGKLPLEYIPLEKIEEELAGLTNKANSGKSFDERRLDHLLACMERNPEYLAKIEVKQREEREKLAPILEQHLATMREFIPPNIFDCTMTTLQEDYGYSKALAKRLISKKCLRLVRMRPEDIMKLHEVELTGQYSHGGQVLDVVEKTALLAACPKKFENDGRGVKKKYLLDLEENVKDMIHKAEAGSLSKQLLRHSAYTNQAGRFGANTEMHRPDVTSGADAFNPRTSYKLASPISTDIGLTEESVLLGQFNSVDGSDFSSDPSTANRKGSSSVGIGSNEFLMRSSSLELMFRRNSSLTKSNEEEIKCAGIGRNEFTKRSSSVEALLSKKSLSFSPNDKDSKISDKNEKSLAELHQDSRLVLVATDDEDESVLL